LLSGRLSALSPLDKISRGFGYISGRDGTKIESVSQVKPGEELSVRLSDGIIKTRILEIEHE
ncbi:MAG: exodeoxyribonuclease VII large subunit, partial [Hungatella sp.]